MIFFLIITGVLIVILILLGVAFITLFERELLGLSQNRLRPNKIIFIGVLQALLDGLKLVKKELILPKKRVDLIFLFVPLLGFSIMYLEWFVLPYLFNFINFNFSVVFLLCLIGFIVYTTLLSGFIRNSKYAFLGSVRSRRQSISFEIVFSLFFLCLIVTKKRLEIRIFINFFNFFLFFLFIVIILVELNRAPFDFSEGERELVRGFNVEFRRFSFALLFLAEYGSLMFFRVFLTFIFFFNNIIIYLIVFFLFLLIRRVYPRYRYDLLIKFF